MPANQTLSPPPLVDLQLITSTILHNTLGVERVRIAMHAPGAPAPAVGGNKRGSKTLWGAQAVHAYFQRIGAEGWGAVVEGEVTQ